MYNRYQELIIPKRELTGVNPGLVYVTAQHRIAINSNPQWVITDRFTNKFYAFYASEEFIINLFKLTPENRVQ